MSILSGVRRANRQNTISHEIPTTGMGDEEFKRVFASLRTDPSVAHVTLRGGTITYIQAIDRDGHDDESEEKARARPTPWDYLLHHPPRVESEEDEDEEEEDPQNFERPLSESYTPPISDTHDFINGVFDVSYLRYDLGRRHSHRAMTQVTTQTAPMLAAPASEVDEFWIFRTQKDGKFHELRVYNQIIKSRSSAYEKRRSFFQGLAAVACLCGGIPPSAFTLSDGSSAVPEHITTPTPPHPTQSPSVPAIVLPALPPAPPPVDAGLCIGCCTTERQVLFLPCQHLVLCRSCELTARSTPGPFLCCYCKQEVDSVLRARLA